MEKKRLLFIDLHRGWALLVMIEVHVFNAMLNPAIKSYGWWEIVNYINGLVAPSFLFISGFAFMIAGQRKLENFKKLRFDFWRQIGRILLIWGVGYSLHIPFLSIQEIKNKASPMQMQQFYAVDILHCIAFGILLMFLLRLLIRKDFIYIIVLSALTAFFVVFAPFIEKIEFVQWMPLSIADYLNSVHGSLFPLFPWLGFMLAAGVISAVYSQAKISNKENKFLRHCLWYGAATVFISVLILKLGLIPDQKPNPFFFLERLGVVVLLMAGLRYYEICRSTQKSFVIEVGRESLLVYWLHLQFIYRTAFDGKSLENIVGHRLNVLEAATATLLLALLMIIAAWIWGKFKKNYKKTSQMIVVSIVLVVILLLFIL